MRVLIFANPIAGRGRGKAITSALEAKLVARGLDVRVFLQPVDQIDPADILGHPLFAAITIGGDGTLRGVADFLARILPVGQIPPLVVIALGTANLMRQHLQLDWKVDDIGHIVEQQRIVHLDAARANGSLFLLMVGVGIDAAIVHALDRIRRGPINKLSYVLPGLLALKDYHFPAMSVELDGQLLFASAPALTFVGNVREYGTGFPILPDARSDDGLLDLCVLPCRNPQKLMELALRVVASEHQQLPGVVSARGKRIVIQTETPVPVQLDGDAAGHTPVEIELLPYRLPFIVP